MARRRYLLDPDAPSDAVRNGDLGAPRQSQAQVKNAEWNARHVKLYALRSAFATIRDNREFIEASARDILREKPSEGREEGDTEITAQNAIGIALGALRHILEDEFRSPETPGGS